MRKPIERTVGKPVSNDPREVVPSLEDQGIDLLRAKLDEFASLSPVVLLAKLDLLNAGMGFQRLAECMAHIDGFDHDTADDVENIVNNYMQFTRSFKEARHSPSESRSYSDTSSIPLAREMFEVVGAIKWFDAIKGYGFIVPDDDLPDILLHVTCLRAGGYQTAYEGARIHCQVLRRPRGLQAFRILSMDETTAVHPSQLPERTNVAVEIESGWERAMVIWFNRVRGFGFLNRGEGTPDIFITMETLRRCGIAEIRPGQIFRVRWGRGPKGCTAAVIEPDVSPAGRTN